MKHNKHLEAEILKNVRLRTACSILLAGSHESIDKLAQGIATQAELFFASRLVTFPMEVFCAPSTDADYETQRGQNRCNTGEVTATRKINIFYYGPADSNSGALHAVEHMICLGLHLRGDKGNFATRPEGPRNGILQLKPEMVNCSESGNLLRKLMKWSFAHPGNIHEKGRTSPQKECLVADFASEVWSARPTISGVVTQRGSLFHEILRDPPDIFAKLFGSLAKVIYPKPPPHPIRRGRKTGYGPGADHRRGARDHMPAAQCLVIGRRKPFRRHHRGNQQNGPPKGSPPTRATEIAGMCQPFVGIIAWLLPSVQNPKERLAIELLSKEFEEWVNRDNANNDIKVEISDYGFPGCATAKLECVDQDEFEETKKRRNYSYRCAEGRRPETNSKVIRALITAPLAATICGDVHVPMVMQKSKSWDLYSMRRSGRRAGRASRRHMEGSYKEEPLFAHTLAYAETRLTEVIIAIGLESKEEHEEGPLFAQIIQDRLPEGATVDYNPGDGQQNGLLMIKAQLPEPEQAAARILQIIERLKLAEYAGKPEIQGCIEALKESPSATSVLEELAAKTRPGLSETLPKMKQNKNLPHLIKQMFKSALRTAVSIHLAGSRESIEKPVQEIAKQAEPFFTERPATFPMKAAKEWLPLKKSLKKVPRNALTFNIFKEVFCAPTTDGVYETAVFAISQEQGPLQRAEKWRAELVDLPDATWLEYSQKVFEGPCWAACATPMDAKDKPKAELNYSKSGAEERIKGAARVNVTKTQH
ncbi:unnamed protein product, partial [Mesorhabditis spiculigera]